MVGKNVEVRPLALAGGRGALFPKISYFFIIF
jgi:hypothetical protein